MRGSIWRQTLAGLTVAILAFGASANAQEDDGSLAFAYRQYVDAIESGDDAAATEYAQKAYARGKEALGEDDVQVGYLASNYGEMLLYDGDATAALSLYTECTEILALYMPDTYLDLANCWAEIGWIQNNLGNKEPLIQAFSSVIGLIDETEEDIDALALLADAHLVIGLNIVPFYAPYLAGYEDTLEMYRLAHDHAVKALALFERLGYDETERAANAHQLVAYWLGMREDSDFVQANEHYLAAYNILLPIYGAGDQRVLRPYARHRGLVNSDEFLPEAIDRRLGGRCLWVNPDGTKVKSCDIKRVEPVYPDEVADAEGYDGRGSKVVVVHIMYDINEQGRTENLRTVFALGSPVFEEVIKKAMSRWVYQKPATLDGKPTGIYDVTTQFQFQLFL